jgi:hypothetical protein
VAPPSVVSSRLSGGAIGGIAAACAITVVATVAIVSVLFYKLTQRKISHNGQDSPKDDSPTIQSGRQDDTELSEWSDPRRGSNVAGGRLEEKPGSQHAALRSTIEIYPEDGVT